MGQRRSEPASGRVVHVPDKRSQILDAATALMAERGGRGTSIAAVAEQVGISDAGVLYHFGTKESLLLAVLERFDRGVEATIDAGGARGRTLLEQTREWGAGMEVVPEIQSLLILLTAEHLRTEGPARSYLRARYRRLLDRYSAAFRDAAAAGELRADLDPHHEASAFLAYLDGIRLQWFLLDGAVSMADGVRTYVDGMLRRLAP